MAPWQVSEELPLYRYCLSPYGFGWGIRTAQAVVAGCVPLVIQPHVFQPFEDVLDYDAFSVRLPRWVGRVWLCLAYCPMQTCDA
jgi:hypothetical protein